MTYETESELLHLLEVIGKKVGWGRMQLSEMLYDADVRDAAISIYDVGHTDGYEKADDDRWWYD